MSTAIIILLGFVFLIWFISRWLRLAASPDRLFLSPDDHDIPKIHDVPPADVTSRHIAAPKDSNSKTPSSF